eukprot:7386588-Prymnesium_polylepis.2
MPMAAEAAAPAAPAARPGPPCSGSGSGTHEHSEAASRRHPRYFSRPRRSRLRPVCGAEDLRESLPRPQRCPAD